MRGILVGIIVSRRRLVRDVARRVADRIRVLERLRRREQPDRHARDGGVDARLVGEQPCRQAERRIERERADVQALARLDHEQADQCECEPPDRHAVAVEDGDDDDGADVVDHGDRQQEHLERHRDTAAEQREHPKGKGDVGGHRDAPTLLPRIAGGDRQVEARGHHHATDRGEQRQQRGSPVAQFAHGELPLDLEADDEEEERHQAVVDDMAQRVVE